jgi:hypothetical protein
MAFMAPAAGLLALRAAAPPVVALGGWSVSLLRRNAWLGWCVCARAHTVHPGR